MEKFILSEFPNVWRKIGYTLTDANKKIQKGEKNNMTIEEIKNNRGKFPVGTIPTYSIAIKYTDILCLDIDEVDFDYTKLSKKIQKLPYTEGNTKGRHYFFKVMKKIDWFGTNINIFKDFKGDCIGINMSSANLWEKADKTVYNYKDYIPFLKFDKYIKPMLKEQYQNHVTNPITKVRKKSCLIDNNIINTCPTDLLDKLGIERWTEYNSWLQLLFIFKNENWDIKIFKNYSKKNCPEKYDENEIDIKWMSAKRNGLTIGTLKKMIKEDTINEIDINELIINFSDKVIAHTLYKLREITFVNDMSYNKLYYINEYNIYKEDLNLFKIKEYINSIEDFVKKCSIKLQNELNDKLINEKLDAKQFKISRNEIIKQTNKLIKFLGTAKAKEGIIQEYRLLVTETGLFNKLDLNSHLFAFNNGVYDLDKQEFRLPDIKEYVFTTCGYDYREPCQKSLELMEQVFRDIYDSEEDYEYGMNILSLSLSGNVPKQFYIHIGKGNNGKSFVMNCLNSVIGEYYGSAPIDYLTKFDKQFDTSKSADPVMFGSMKKRHLSFNEAENMIVLKASLLKTLTGNDEITARGLYASNICSFKPQFKIHILTNNLCNFDAYDTPFVSRISVVDYKIQFVTNPELPNEKLMNSSYSKLMDNLDNKLALFTLLCSRYNAKIIKPTSSIQKLKEFIQQNDPVTSFFNENIKITNDPFDKINKNELYENFKQFLLDNGGKYLSNSQFYKICENKYNIERCVTDGIRQYRKLVLIKSNE